MQNFINEYINVLYEERGKIQISIEEYEDFLRKAVKFDENLDIVEEFRQNLIDIPEDLIHYLMENSHSRISEKNLKFFLKKSRHWRNIKNVNIGDVYFDVFDFSDISEIDRFHYSCFKIKNLEIPRNLFIRNCQHLFGFYSQAPDGTQVICVNSKAADIFQTVYHEFSHLIQAIGDIRIINGLSLDDIKDKDRLYEKFGTVSSKVVEYFSDKEFIPHLDDLKKDLKKCRDRFYKDIPGLEFRKTVFTFLNCRNLEEMENNELYRNFWKMNKGDMSSLTMFLFSKILGYRFQLILDHLREIFID